MYSSSTDEATSALVGVYSNGGQEDADHERSIQSIGDSDALAAALNRRHVVILVTEERTPRPPAVWRRRMANANNELRAHEYYFALVAPSVMVRGAFTAINWLMRPRPGHHLAAFHSFDEAVAWVRAQTGESYSSLEDLHASARAKHGT